MKKSIMLLLSEIKHTCCRVQRTYYLHCDDEERKHHTLTVTKVFYVKVLGVDYLWARIQLRLKTRRHSADSINLHHLRNSTAKERDYPRLTSLS